MLEGITNYIFSWLYVLGPLGFILVMVLQAVIAPIPSELVLVLGGAFFGLIGGTILGGVGEVCGAIAAFVIAKKLGRRFVKKLVPKSSLEFADKWFDNWGGWAVLMGRLTPFIPFDAVSYFAGLTRMGFTPFIVATAVGAFPRALFYSWVGYMGMEVLKTGIESKFAFLMTIVAIFIAAVMIGKYYVSKKYEE